MIHQQTIKAAPEIAARNAAYVLPLLLCLTIAVIPAPMWIKNLATDDALYYPTVARNIALGLGSTYDGITQTNGYHPLWCWLQVPIAAITGFFGSMTYLWFVKFLVAVVVAMALVVWERVIRCVTGSNWMSATFVQSGRIIRRGMILPKVTFSDDNVRRIKYDLRVIQGTK